MARPKGYKHTPEELEKMRGRKHTPEELEKMSAWQKGRPKSEETKQKLREAAIKRYSTTEVRKKIARSIKLKYETDPTYKNRVCLGAIRRCENPAYLKKRSEAMKNYWKNKDREEWSLYQRRLFSDPNHKEKVYSARNAPDVMERIIKATKERWADPEYKLRVGKKIGEAHSGEKSVHWRGGISFEPYCSKFNRSLKENIRETFGRKCFICGKNENENKCRLNIHHIDYDKKQGCNGKDWDLIPLCNSCHGKTNHNRTYWNEELSIRFHSLRFKVILWLT